MTHTLFFTLPFHKKEEGSILLPKNMLSVSWSLPSYFAACPLTPTQLTKLTAYYRIRQGVLGYYSSSFLHLPFNQPCTVVKIADSFGFSSSFTEEKKTNYFQVSRIIKSLRFYPTCRLISQPTTFLYMLLDNSWHSRLHELQVCTGCPASQVPQGPCEVVPRLVPCTKQVCVRAKKPPVL